MKTKPKTKKKRKYLTEEHAWDLLGESYRKYHVTGILSLYTIGGICASLSRLLEHNKITLATKHKMDQRIGNFMGAVQATGMWTGSYLGPRDQGNAKRRSDLARFFSVSCAYEKTKS